jgi:Fe-S-cluster-containing dehydrogenase component/anaerobic selenocysteine-containing dehydrogenase
VNSDSKEFRRTEGRSHHYRSLAELSGSSSRSTKEFAFQAPPSIEVSADGISRRRFLGFLSASAALALGASSCSTIDRGKIVPYTRKPEGTIPGMATYYASTFQEGLITQGVLVKTREGRPIHVEGNAEHAISRGKTSLRAVADLLGLYDPDRLRNPSADGIPSSWEKAEQEIPQALKAARDAGRPVLLLTEAVVSPTRNALIGDLKRALPRLHHAAWEPAVSQPEMLAARALYGEAVLPKLRFDRADVILSLQADFLGSDGNASALIRDFAARRGISGPTESMNRLWVIEGCMTLTGANADQRLQVRPSKVAALVFALARFLNELYGLPLPKGVKTEGLRSFDLDSQAKGLGIEAHVLRALAEDLKRAGKSAMVLAGPALPREAHVACQLLNCLLGAEGHTVDATLAPPGPEILTFAGLQDLLKQASEGAFAAAIFWGTNPAYTFPQASLWKSAVTKIPTKIRIGLYEDETALDCRWRLPEHHWLESWGDFEPAADFLSLRQPTIGAIHNTRQGEDILLSWLRILGADTSQTYLDYVKARWQREVYPSGSPVSFESFWSAALHDGVLKREAKPRPPRIPQAAAIMEAMEAMSAALSSRAASAELELVLLPDAGVYDGRYANNGWLNELPNPVTKGTWENPLLLSLSDAERLGLNDEDLVKVAAGAESVEVPIIIQPGQMPGVVSLALGYGRRTGSVAAGIGANAYPLMDASAASPNWCGAVKITGTGGRRVVPRTQEHFSMEGRDLARSWTLGDYARKVKGEEAAKAEKEPASLIPGQKFTEHKWGMVIDLSACVGCSACLIACQSENNVPVVGPDRVHRSREMHWIRIDRYYEGDPRDPSVIHQPIPCQHCDDAPCEIVCPVNATTHSPDGLNQMAYNRCVGTRYCSNNCPFKVRRFNFFDYTSFRKEPELLVFNPEVTVRPRGVMEKCSFCIQRIQDVKRQLHGAIGVKLPLLVEDFPQQLTLNPLHHHVNLAAVVVGQHLHHAGVIQLFANFLLPMEAVEESRVALHLGMRDLDGDRATGAQIRTAKDRGHAAACGDAFNAVVIELIARMEWSHWQRG